MKFCSQHIIFEFEALVMVNIKIAVYRAVFSAKLWDGWWIGKAVEGSGCGLF
jgi:hypothetical protein